jgi:hypothetical protein
VEDLVGLLAEVGPDHLGVGPDLVGCALGQELAEVQAVDVVADLDHQRHVVLDHHHGEVELPAELQQRGPEGVGLLRPHARRRLVEEEQVGVGGQHGPELDPFEDAVGEPGHPGVEQLGQPEDVGQRLGPPPEPPLGDERARQAHHPGQRGVAGLEVLGGEEVLPHGGTLHQPHVLEGAAHPQRRALVDLEPGDVAALEPHAALVGPVEAGDDVEGRRLAGAVGADDADDLPLAGPEADVAGRLHATETDRAALHLKHGHRSPSLRRHGCAWC